MIWRTDFQIQAYKLAQDLLATGVIDEEHKYETVANRMGYGEWTAKGLWEQELFACGDLPVRDARQFYKLTVDERLARIQKVIDYMQAAYEVSEEKASA